MILREKTVNLTGGAIVLILLLLYWLGRTLILASFADMEQARGLEKAEHALRAFQREVSHFRRTVQSWSVTPDPTPAEAENIAQRSVFKTPAANGSL